MKRHDHEPKGRFALCVRNDDYEGELELHKLYVVLPDGDAELHDQIRVIDESGEDYLYPRSFFQDVEPSQVSEVALRRAS